jgi:acyl dehydratase
MAARWEDLDVGAAAEPRTIGPLTRTDFVRYQGASGDFNPIHHDEEFAKSAGYPTVFSVGMLQAGILASYATDWLGADNVRNFGVQFREQVWPGDSLVCTGTVVSRIDPSEGANGDERTVNLELIVERVGGGTAIKGWATFAVPA